MADFRTKLCREVIIETRHHFEDKVYKTIIPRNIKLSEAPSFGKSIMDYDKDCLGAQKYLEFANEFLQYALRNVQSERSVARNTGTQLAESPQSRSQLKQEIL